VERTEHIDSIQNTASEAFVGCLEILFLSEIRGLEI